MCDLNNLNDELMNNSRLFLFDQKSENPISLITEFLL